MQGLQQLKGLIRKSPANKHPGEYRSNNSSLIGLNRQSSDRLDSIWKGHLKTFSDVIPPKTLANASLGFVQAEKVRSSRHRHPRDRVQKNPDFPVESAKSHQMWLPKVTADSDTARNQQNILACSWSSLTGKQRRSKWVRHKRELDKMWQSSSVGIHPNGDLSNSKMHTGYHQQGASVDSAVELVSIKTITIEIYYEFDTRVL